MKNMVTTAFEGHPMVVSIAFMAMYGRYVNPLDDNDLDNATKALFQTRHGVLMMELVADFKAMLKLAEKCDTKDAEDVKATVAVSTVAFISSCGGVLGLNERVRELRLKHEARANQIAESTGAAYMAVDGDGGAENGDGGLKNEDLPQVGMVSISKQGDIDEDISALPEEVQALVKGLAAKVKADWLASNDKGPTVN